MALKVLALGGDGIGPEVIRGADIIDAAVAAALNAGFATCDLGGEHTTQQTTDAVIRQYRSL